LDYYTKLLSRVLGQEDTDAVNYAATKKTWKELPTSSIRTTQSFYAEAMSSDMIVTR